VGAVRWSGGAPVLPVNVLVSARKVALAESNLMRSLAPAVGGQLSFDGTIESDEMRLAIGGNAELGSVRLSSAGEPAKDPLRFVVAVDYNRLTGAGTVNRCDAMLPKGAASITGSYSLLKGGAQVNLEIMAQGIPVTPVSSLAPAAGLPLPPGASLEGGLGFLELRVEGPLTAPTTKGSVMVQNTKLMAFDLEERLSAVTGLDALHISRDLPIDSLSGEIEMTPEKVTVKDIEIDLPEVGIMTGSGAIDANRLLDFQMIAIRNGLSEKRPIPFQVRGVSASPVFRQAGKTL
jgi:hypothetical protein